MSEADAALCMHIARNGGDLDILIALLRASGLRRPKLRRDDYVMRQALFALSDVEVRTPKWSGITVAPKNDPEREAVERLEECCASGLDAVLLQRIAQEITAQWQRGEHREDGWFRVSPQALSGDFAPRPGLPPPEKIMSRQGCLKALKRLAAEGVFELAESEEEIVWYASGNRRTRKGKVMLLQVSGTGVLSILNGFADRLSGGPEVHSPTPVYVLETHFHNDESGAAA